MKIFLDDLRPVPDEFDLVFRSGKAMLKYLKENPNQHYELISFDHDLGENTLTGYDVVKEIVDDLDINFTFDRIQFHTANVVGFRNMYYYLVNAQIYDLFPPGIIDKNFKDLHKCITDFLGCYIVI